MNPTERSTRKPSAKAALLAALRTCVGAQGRGARFIDRLASPLLVAFAFLLAASPAAAEYKPHEFESAFGFAGSAAGQFHITPESGIAVDQATGDLYLADTGNHRVDEFSAAGAFLRAFGWGVANGAAEAQVCTTTCQPGLPGPEAGQFEDPNFLAVDNTPGGNGDLYVADNGSVANEVQTVTLSGAGGGSFTLTYTSQFHATTSEGSDVLTHVYGLSGLSVYGHEISGPGIPPGTTLVKETAKETYEISAPASASATDTVLGVSLTSASIPGSATASELQTILENTTGRALEGHVSVSGGPGGPWTLEFIATLAAYNVPQLTCDASSLTPAGATCTVATAVEGRNTARVQKFDPAGHLITAWGGTPYPGAVDGTTCPAGQEGICGSRPHFALFGGLTVMPDGVLLVSDVVLVSGHARSGYSELAQSSGAEINRPGTFGYGYPIGIASDSFNHVYIAQKTSSKVEVIQTSPCWGETIYSSVCEKEPVLSRPPDAYQKNFTLDHGPANGVAVDPATDDVFVSHYEATSLHSSVFAYDSQANALESPFGGGGEITQAGTLAAYGLNDNVYVVDPGANRIEIFRAGGPHATLKVDRTGSGLGSVASAPAGISCPFTCTASFPVGEELTLTATAPEHSAFLGFSGGGCSGTGTCSVTLNEATTVSAAFAQNLPLLTTEPASAVSRNTAALSGTIDPEADASSCAFQYGTTTAYGQEAPCSTHPGAGAEAVPVGAGLFDLAAETTYHFRLVSANSGGTAYGPDQSFTTLSEAALGSAPSCATQPSLCARPKPEPPSLHCRRGYVKRIVNGREVCVKKHRRHRKAHHH